MFINADNFTVFIFPSFKPFKRDRVTSPIVFFRLVIKKEMSNPYWNRTATHEENIENHEGLILCLEVV